MTLAELVGRAASALVSGGEVLTLGLFADQRTGGFSEDARTKTAKAFFAQPCSIMPTSNTSRSALVPVVCIKSCDPNKTKSAGNTHTRLCFSVWRLLDFKSSVVLIECIVYEQKQEVDMLPNDGTMTQCKMYSN